MDNNKSSFKLKPWSPLGCLFLSLFIPFYYIFWLVASHKQVRIINSLKTKDSKMGMGPWWSFWLFIGGVILIVGSFAIAIFGNVNEETLSELDLAVTTVSAHGSDLYHNGELPPPVYYEIETPDDQVIANNSTAAQALDGSGEAESDEFTVTDALFALFYLLGLLMFLAFAIVHFLYLMGRANLITRLANSEQDRTPLIVFAAVGCFVFPYLLVAFVYKSQLLANQAIADLSS